jgi:hypothetical protein
MQLMKRKLSMSNAKFPAFKSDEDAKCFSCDKLLASSKVTDEGFAPGSGRYAKYCTDCRCKTYYDVSINFKNFEE